ncbi:GDSL lipase/acylhydrolase [Hymenopellis radicata]|nr:GDSL lipase/acylhydrolase [Hymenopellis radicata]
MSVILSTVLLALFAPIAAQGIKPGQLTDFVTFGDSYTDIVNVGDGGIAWPVYAAGYANLTLHPFAKSGGTCSNLLTPRPFPSIFESQLPAYFNASLNLNPKRTLYTQWIGTNDVGVYSLLTGSNAASIVDVTECMIEWVKVLYKSGARNFLLQNMIPLQTTILYAPDSYPNKFFNTERNTTEWAVSIRELVLSGNKLSQLMLQDLAPTLPGAHIGIFDSHSLFQDMFDNPAKYLNGTAPLNVTGAVLSCVFPLNSDEGTCTQVDGTDRDSYLWWDELHPSEQADRIVAREIAKTMSGQGSQWETWIS